MFKLPNFKNMTEFQRLIDDLEGNGSKWVLTDKQVELLKAK